MSSRYDNAVRISVIIPVFNGAPYIEQILNKLNGALSPRDEVILIDNNSTDGSSDIVKKINGSLSVPIVLLHESKQGAAAARNKGLMDSSGKYVVFIDVDDEVESSRFAVQHDFLESNTEYEMVLGKTFRSDTKKTLPPYLNSSGEVNPHEIGERILKHFGSTPHLCAYMFRKSFLTEKKIVFADELRTGQDLFFQMQSLFQANKVYFLDEIVYTYVKRKTSTTTLSKKKKNGNENAYNQFKFIKSNIGLFNIRNSEATKAILASVNTSIIGNYRDYIYSMDLSISEKAGLFKKFIFNEFQLTLKFSQSLICNVFFFKKNKIAKKLFYVFVLQGIMRQLAETN
jgi:glycosyltransferase involved in cell wall biosynthesis